MNVNDLMELLDAFKVAGFGGHKVLTSCSGSESDYCGVIRTVILDIAHKVVIIES